MTGATHAMRYRPEIDGLRAVAVIPVILFHAGITAFSGGFIGVDIFFVISGYLITSIILNESDSPGGFSFWRFYDRRIRRIIPALYLVLSVSAVFSYLYMLPDPLENFGQSLVATVLFSNNVLLTLTSGYWDLAVEFKPLVHTWSLGVEEQYYIVFPTLMLLLWRFARGRAFAVILAVAIASLLLTEWAYRATPSANFYLLHTRAWELLAGSLCAIFSVRNGLLKSNWVSALGLVLIAVPIFAYGEWTPFPSLYALAPVLGTALIIMFGTGGTVVAALLSTRPMVAVGLISYSAYLWHQPLFAFARIHGRAEPPAAIFYTLIVLTLILSGLTWWLVERPFRNRRAMKARLLYPLFAVTTALLLGAGYLFHATHGLPQRVFPEQLASASDMYISYNQRAFGLKRDRFSGEKEVKLLIIGNSFGRDFTNMVTENIDTSRIEIVYRDDMSECLREEQDAVLSGLVKQSDVIVFASGTVRANCMNDDIAYAESMGKALFYAGIKNFGYNMNWLTRVPAADRKGAVNDLLPSTVADDRLNEATIPGDHYISILRPILIGGKVPITDEQGRLISPDTAHLTRHGALYVGSRVMRHVGFRRALKLDS